MKEKKTSLQILNEIFFKSPKVAQAVQDSIRKAQDSENTKGSENQGRKYPVNENDSSAN